MNTSKKSMLVLLWSMILAIVNGQTTTPQPTDISSITTTSLFEISVRLLIKFNTSMPSTTYATADLETITTNVIDTAMDTVDTTLDGTYQIDIYYDSISNEIIQCELILYTTDDSDASLLLQFTNSSAFTASLTSLLTTNIGPIASIVRTVVLSTDSDWLYSTTEVPFKNGFNFWDTANYGWQEWTLLISILLLQFVIIAVLIFLIYRYETSQKQTNSGAAPSHQTAARRKVGAASPKYESKRADASSIAVPQTQTQMTTTKSREKRGLPKVFSRKKSRESGAIDEENDDFQSALTQATTQHQHRVVPQASVAEDDDALPEGLETTAAMGGPPPPPMFMGGASKPKPPAPPPQRF